MAPIPAHHDPIELKAGLLNVGNDKAWPTGIEQCRFDLTRPSGPGVSGSACATIDKSNLRAIRPKISHAPRNFCFKFSRNSAETAERRAASSNLLMAALAAFSFSMR